jgi:NAD(P)-dependent dehydrogenase (short-subunit alcohol dehydrogenase family)
MEPATLDYCRLGPAKGSRMLVVGGAGGIGRALVAAGLEIGLEMAVFDRAEALRLHPSPAGIREIAVDVASEDSLRGAFAELARDWSEIDTLVCLAGIPIFPPKPLSQVSVAEWDRVLDINLRGTFLAATLAVPFLERAGGGAIVTVSSSQAYSPPKGVGAYVASKGGIVALTKSLAVELAPSIRANVVAPAAVDTDFLAGGTGQIQEGGADWFQRTREAYVSTIPLARVANADDVVGPILFLAGAASRFMTGQVVHVNGGRVTP